MTGSWLSFTSWFIVVKFSHSCNSICEPNCCQKISLDETKGVLNLMTLKGFSNNSAENVVFIKVGRTSRWRPSQWVMPRTARRRLSVFFYYLRANITICGKTETFDNSYINTKWGGLEINYY